MNTAFHKVFRLLFRLLKDCIDLFDDLYNNLQFRAFQVKVGEGTKIRGRLLICGRQASVTIGKRVIIRSRYAENPIGGAERASLRTIKGGRIEIGDDTGISNSAIVALDSVIIGSHVLIGGNCKIYDTDFHSLNYEERILSPDPGVLSKPVVIRDGAFIGANSIILKGVTVGEKSVVGAGSVVTKSIPDGELWAGNPARFIRKLETRAPEGRNEA